MIRLRLSGRGIAYAASALIHGGVVWALLPSLTGSAAPTPAETPMAIEMPSFAGTSEAVDTADPVETAQAEPVETVPSEPVQPMQTVPPDTVPDQPVEAVTEEPPPPAETPVTETAEIQPPEQAPDEPPPEVVTTTGESESVVAAVPETVQAEEPEIVPPPAARPKPPAERRPQRQQQRRSVEQPAEAPSQTAALPRQTAPPPAAAPAASAQVKADYAAQLQGYLGRRVRSVSSMVRDQMTVGATVTIEADGSLSAIEVTRSSGSATVDAEILRKLRSASPVPAPPARLANLYIPFRIDPGR
ncbi:TonB family protein [Inquilinus sp.]|uniref:TonB family protein n=1 Tax=Inquilinus sp. TaxID=1932117 RepID=UPI0031E27107